jgi:hypothetical protein
MSDTPEVKHTTSLIKPTAETLFHIDFDWWQANDSNWRIFLFEFLCSEHQAYFKDKAYTTNIDAIDPDTGEIKQVDGLLYELMHHCAKKDDFISANIPIIAKVLRTFLANGNKPLSAGALAEIVNRPVATVLATLSGPQVFKGIRQFQK